jgi:molybdopterin converting factor small subunit
MSTKPPASEEKMIGRRTGRYTVRLFAGLREGLGESSVSIEVPIPCSSLDLKRRFADEYPKIGELVMASRVASDLQFLADEAILPCSTKVTSDENRNEDHSPLASAKNDPIVDLIPPVSGG